MHRSNRLRPFLFAVVVVVVPCSTGNGILGCKPTFLHCRVWLRETGTFGWASSFTSFHGTHGSSQVLTVVVRCDMGCQRIAAHYASLMASTNRAVSSGSAWSEGQFAPKAAAERPAAKRGHAERRS
jgi:hypothetical protein